MNDCRLSIDTPQSPTLEIGNRRSTIGNCRGGRDEHTLSRPTVRVARAAAQSRVRSGRHPFVGSGDWSQRRHLQPCLLFRLVDLLGFRNLGRWEKTDWSVPIEFRGQIFLIEYRKFGIGIFVPHAAAHERQAREIVTLIHKGVRAAEPYFAWLTEQAVAASKLNVMNRSGDLFARFNFLLAEYQNKWAEAVAREDERHIETKEENGVIVTIGSSPAFELRKHAEWLGLSAIDAFFSWTEHIFIHLAILTGKISTGSEVADMIDADWISKFKKALNMEEPATKAFLDKLIAIRRQIRNFFAHGSFGKQGEAFEFHSGAGAVPVLLPHKAGQQRFSLIGDVTSDERTALKVI